MSFVYTYMFKQQQQIYVFTVYGKKRPVKFDESFFLIVFSCLKARPNASITLWVCAIMII